MSYDIKDLVRRDMEQTERVRRARLVDRLVILSCMLGVLCLVTIGVYL